MAGTTLASADAIFKRNYNEGSEVLVKQQNLNAPFWGKIPVSPLKPSGAGIFNPVVMSGNEAGGAQFEDEGFQEPDSINPVQPYIKAKKVIWPFQITGDVIELSETDKVAFAKGLDAQQQDNMARIYSDLNRQAWGTGTGQITLANGAGSPSTSLIVDDVLPFRVGMSIDAYASMGGALQIDGVKITAINYTTSTLTLAASSTWSDNAVICKHNILKSVDHVAGIYKELMGVRGIIDTTTYSTTFEGVSVASYSNFVGNVIDASTSPVSQDLLQRTFNRNAIIGGTKPDLLCSNYGQARTFLNTELQKTRYEAGKVEGGNVVLKWGTMEWLVDHTFPIGEVVMMPKGSVEKFQTRDVHLSDLTGMTLYQKDSRDAVGGYYVYRGNIGTWKRNDKSRLINLTEPSL
jgi:hypothetical protein